MLPKLLQSPHSNSLYYIIGILSSYYINKYIIATIPNDILKQ